MMVGLVAVIIVVGGLASRGDTASLTIHPRVAIRPLSKPEPDALLRQPGLALTIAEQTRIAAIQRSWSADKAELVKEMSGFAPRQGRLDQVDAGLQGYSDLSRSYDSIRAQYWAKALAILDTTQRSKAEGGGK